MNKIRTGTYYLDSAIKSNANALTNEIFGDLKKASRQYRQAISRGQMALDLGDLDPSQIKNVLAIFLGARFAIDRIWNRNFGN